MDDGRLAQLEERFPYKEEAGGSSPSAPTSEELTANCALVAGEGYGCGATLLRVRVHPDQARTGGLRQWGRGDWNFAD